MVVAKMQMPPDEATYAARLKNFRELGPEIEQHTRTARKLIISIIEDPRTPSDNAALARIETRIDVTTQDLSGRMNDESLQLLAALDGRDLNAARLGVNRVDALRDEFIQRIDAIRADMLAQVFASAGTVIADQKTTIIVSGVVTALAAVIGLIFAMLVSGGITRPVRLLLEGTRHVEAGHLDRAITITTQDEIGQLSLAFNRMIEQLRHNENIRQTFGKFIDPQIVKGLIDQPALAAEGKRRIMTVMFCDMKGFSALSEGMTPQGLVKVTNRYLSTMSEPIRNHQGIIDKYIGDAIMAYWGPPFIDEADQARLACLAALDMVASVGTLRKELPELLGMRNIPMDLDIRIGIATGEALVGSIGSEFMMSYTVMGDTVNLASRVEPANKIYGSHALVSEATARMAEAAIELREIDRLVVSGQSQAQTLFEIMGAKGGLNEPQVLLRSRYAEGLGAYRARRFDDARGSFNAALAAVPADGPSMALLKRIDGMQASPPPSDWDGAWPVARG
jgi:adenylate cyclase